MPKAKEKDSFITENLNILFFLIVILIILIAMLALNNRVIDLENQLEKVPKRVCHTETIVLKYNSSSNSYSKTSEKPFPSDSEFLRQICYMNYMDNNEHICFVEKSKEVCEIK